MPVAAMAAGPRRATFERDVEPILTRAGCNAGACHGKARGQNGFALSLLGFDPDFDHDAIAREGAGPSRLPRVARGEPAAPQGVGEGPPRRRPAAQAGHPVLSRRSAGWIAAGMPRDAGRRAEAGRGSPSSRPSAPLRRGESFPLRVTARRSPTARSRT